MTKIIQYFLILIFSTYQLSNSFALTVEKSGQIISANKRLQTYYQQKLGISLQKQYSWINYYGIYSSEPKILLDSLIEKHNKQDRITFHLPTTVGEFISFLGNYSEFIYNEDDITEPNGTLCVWKLENGLIVNAGVQLMGSENKPNNQDQIYFYELTSINNNIVENLIFDLTLNKTSLNECSQKFKLNKSNIDNTWKFKQNNIFTYLSFDTNGILIQIGQYTFDYDSVN